MTIMTDNAVEDNDGVNPCPPDVRRDLIRLVAVDGLGYAVPDELEGAFENGVEQVLMAICGELAALGETIALREYVSEMIGWPADDPDQREIDRLARLVEYEQIGERRARIDAMLARIKADNDKALRRPD